MTPNFKFALAILALVAGCLAGYAHAADRTVSWTNPTQYVDGTPLPASEIERTTVVWGSSASQLTQSKVVTGSVNSTVIDLPVGTHFVAAKTTAKGVESGLSNVAQITIAQPAPNPPSGLRVDTETTAYVIKQTRDNIALVAVGQVPPGTQCDGAKGVIANGQTFYVVPRDVVSWAGSVRSEIVVSACG